MTRRPDIQILLALIHECQEREVSLTETTAQQILFLYQELSNDQVFRFEWSSWSPECFNILEVLNELRWFQLARYETLPDGSATLCLTSKGVSRLQASSQELGKAIEDYLAWPFQPSGSLVSALYMQRYWDKKIFKQEFEARFPNLSAEKVLRELATLAKPIDSEERLPEEACV
ncbi:MAG: hypothetical protein AMXMBFR33_17720 [Candidatus Xenobia bacterium]